MARMGPPRGRGGGPGPRYGPPHAEDAARDKAIRSVFGECASIRRDECIDTMMNASCASAF